MTTANPKPCAYELRRQHGVRGDSIEYCVLLAAPRSRYCAVHRDQANRDAIEAKAAPARVRRDLTLDELPWTADDRRIFDGASQRRSKRA
jgi:hypothetical protein